MNIQTILTKGKRFISDPYYRLRVMIKMGAYDSLSDEAFLRKIFPQYMGYPLNLDNPQTFSEKMQWMKLIVTPYILLWLINMRLKII